MFFKIKNIHQMVYILYLNLRLMYDNYIFILFEYNVKINKKGIDL